MNRNIILVVDAAEQPPIVIPDSWLLPGEVSLIPPYEKESITELILRKKRFELIESDFDREGTHIWRLTYRGMNVHGVSPLGDTDDKDAHDRLRDQVLRYVRFLQAMGDVSYPSKHWS